MANIQYISEGMKIVANLIPTEMLKVHLTVMKLHLHKL